jgi:AcrR family transcriptional regulator
MIGIPTLDRKTRRRMATRAEVVAAAWEIAATEGVGGITIRDLAERVGLKAPSLYEYFPSKNAVYDAMFADGWRTFRELMASVPRSGDLRTVLRSVSEELARFWVSQPARFSLLCQRPIPGFEPSRQSYAEAVAVLDDIAAELAVHGIQDRKAIDLFIAVVTGLVSQQIANDPTGDRWLQLLGWGVDIFLTSLNDTGSMTA